MDCILNSFKNIFRKKVRSALTITGIGIGVLSVVIISIIGDVGKLALNQELNSMGISGICIRATNNGNTISLDETQLSTVQKNQNVFAATPLMTKVYTVEARSKASQSIVWGIDSNANQIVSLDLLYGRMITKTDITQYKQVCLVDEAFAMERYKRANVVGKEISIYIDGIAQNFEIVGIVSSGGNILKGLMGDVVPTFLYAPFTTLSRLSQTQGFPQIVAKLKTNTNDSIATTSIVQDLSEKLTTSETIQVENLNQQKDKLNSLLNVVTLILAVIGGISLLVAGLSIMTVMLVTVSERTREIGIKKSIGASKKIILIEFLTESLILSAIGSIIGAVIGILTGILGASLFHLPMIINWNTIIWCMIFCILIGILFGVYPASKAAKLRPVDALRCE